MGLSERFTALDQATGLEIDIQQDGLVNIVVCEIGRKGSRLNIIKVKTDLKEINEAVRTIDVKSAVSLNISGKGVLHRELAGNATDDIEAFHAVLPNSSADDFYIQRFISGERSFISVIRRSEADRWLEKLNEAGLSVFELSLGPFTTANIIDQLNAYDQNVVFDGHQIFRNEAGDWLAYSHTAGKVSAFPFKIGTTTIKEQALVAYAQAFQLLLKPEIDFIEANVGSLKEKQIKSIEQRKLKAFGFVGLIGVFFLLLVNYLVLSHLNDQNARMAGKLTLNSQSAGDLRDIGDKVARNEKLLKALGWESNINKAVLIDQLAGLLPMTITWNEIAVDPQDIQQSQLEKQIVFSSRKIMVKGTSKAIIPINEWMARIRTLGWVKGVTLKNFIYNNEENTGEFSLEVNY